MDQQYHELTYKTRIMHPTEVDGTKSLSKLEIFPKFNDWTFTHLATFLNQHPNFTPVKKSCGTVSDAISNHFMKFIYSASRFRLYIKIQVATNNIQVSISKDYIMQSTQWDKYEINVMSQIGSRGRKTKTTTIKTLVFWEMRISQPNAGTTALLLHKSLIFNSINDFTLGFQYFAKKFMTIHVPNNDDTCSIYEFISIWVNDSKTAITTLETLASLFSGYLHLNLQLSRRKKYLQSIKYDEKFYYIISGVYISPFAESILKRNPGLIQGFILDTTWKILPYYVTSILMASVQNTGIPIAFAFGRGETKISYEMLINIIETQLNFNFSGKILESDQGKALQTLCVKHEMTQILCLRHFLASLKDHYIRTLIGELVKSVSMCDFLGASKVIISQIEQYMNRFPPKVVSIIESLQRIGITFDIEDHALKVTDVAKWRAVSMQERVDLRMPSTTNALESTHGHMNAKTPRNNNFFSAIHRIVKAMMLKTNTINQSIQNNYKRLIRETKREEEAKRRNGSMKDHVAYYNTTADRCHCSSNKLESSILRIDVPCCHRVSLGATFPILNLPDITLENKWPDLEIKYNIIEPEDEHDVTLSLEEQEKQYAINTIKRFTHNKQIDKIAEFVEDMYQKSTTFVNNRGEEMLHLICDGIRKFENN